MGSYDATPCPCDECMKTSAASMSTTAEPPKAQCTICGSKWATIQAGYSHVHYAHITTKAPSQYIKTLESGWSMVESPKPATGSFDKAVNAAILLEQKEIYGKLYGMAPATWTTGSLKKKEEAPMATMTMDKLGQAKKQRDVLRKRVREDLKKYVTMFPGVSEFEAAHAILDAVLKNVNDYATNYGTPEMKFGLAQSFLPDTENIISSGSSSTVVSPFPSAGPTYSDKYVPAIKNKTKPKSHGLAKLDKDVTEADLESTYMIQYSNKSKVITEMQKEYVTLYGDTKFFIFGGKYIYSSSESQNLFGGLAGSIKVLFQVSKSAPYIKEKDINSYALTAPQGYKFRKLKNKPYYKIQKDIKQVNFWAKEDKLQAAKAAVAAGTFNTLLDSVPTNAANEGGPTINDPDEKYITNSQGATIYLYSPYTSQWAKLYPAPQGYVWVPLNLATDTMALVKLKFGMTVPIQWAVDHGPASLGMFNHHWETSTTNPAKAILMDGLVSTSKNPAAKFPPIGWGVEGYEPGGKYAF